METKHFFDFLYGLLCKSVISVMVSFFESYSVYDFSNFFIISVTLAVYIRIVYDKH